MSEAVIEVKNLSRSYEQGQLAVQALRNVSLSIAQHDFVSLFGPSGSGKTTLLNMIGGLDRPSSGRVLVAGEDIGKLSRSALANFRLKHIGFVFQAYNLIPVLSAFENVEFVMQLQGVPKRERRERALEMLGEVGLSGLEKRRPGELSGGQQQRVAVARAIVSRPEIVLADEPTANLDSKTAEALIALMQHMNQRHGITFIFSTHDPLVMQNARRLIGLKDGQIVSDQTRESK